MLLGGEQAAESVVLTMNVCHFASLLPPTAFIVTQSFEQRRRIKRRNLSYVSV